MSNVTINPQWLAYNSLHNEGGEGYNPHSKWIAKVAPVAAAAAKAAPVRYLRDERGNTIGSDKLAARLAAEEATLPRLTDAGAIEGLQKRIAFARAQLAA